MVGQVESLSTTGIELFPLYLAGEFTASEQVLDVVSPYSGQVVYRTYLAGPQELERAILAAQTCRMDLQNLPTYTRFDILRQISEGIKRYQERFAVIMAREAGKPLKTARVEVERAAQTFLVAAEEAKRLPGEVMSLDWTEAGTNKEGIVRYFPVGLIAGISPFNFPLNLVAHKLAPAIAAGCPIILKPASKTPISALLLAALINDTALPKGALSVLPMDRESGNRLVTDPRFAMLSFTGSPDVGWAMKQQAGKKKVTLELGGNAGLIVDRDANLDRAVPRAILGAFGNAGQSCIHTQRILVQDALWDAFIERFLAAAEQLKLGDPEDESTDMSAMIDERNAQRIEAWVREAVDGGAKVLLGGQRQGAVHAPTVLTHTAADMKVCYMETFGPTVVIERYTDFEDAVALINASPFGLQAGVFTHDYRKIHYAYRHLEVGGVIINDVPTFRAEQMPYGGVKDSGLGREGPKYAIMDMLEPKVLVLDHN